MSSIRPLATITFLVCVGVFLYLKINETEPVLPEGVGEFALEDGLELDDPGVDAFGAGASTGSSFAGSADAGNGPPPFAAGSAVPAYDSSAASDAPPAWNAPVAAAPADDSPSTASREVPDMPEVPSVMGEDGGEDGTVLLSSKGPIDLATKVPGSPIIQEEEEERLGIDTYDPSQESSSQESYTSQPPAAESTASTTPTPETSLFAATRVAVQAALDRGELSQALLLLSDWHGDPSLSDAEAAEVNQLLSQLAGTVIYSNEPRLEDPYMVRAGETLPQIAEKYDVPWQLLAKVNGLASPDAIRVGQQLKVIPGPFNAKIDISSREITLMLGRRYAGRFPIEVDPGITVEDGTWAVDQKLITPSGSLYGAGDSSTESRSMVLSNPSTVGGQVAVLRASTGTREVASEPASRTIKLRGADVNDLYDILSVGSRVTIQR